MNRSLPRPAALVIASAVALGLAACDQGTAPDTTPGTAESTDDIIQTLVELTPEPLQTEVPPIETPSAAPDPAAPSPAAPGAGTLTFVPPIGLPHRRTA